MIDIGSYAFMRKLHKKLVEIDLFASNAKEKIRNAPILDVKDIQKLWQSAPSDFQKLLLASGDVDG